jgi:hypothetical protein
VGQALFSPFAARGVHIDLIPTFTAATTVSPEVSLLVRIDAHDIAFTAGEDGRHDARIDLVARAGSEWNEPGEVVSKEVVLHLKEESFREAMRIGLHYPVSITPPHPGLYDIRVAVRDQASRKLGSARNFVEVPDLLNGKLALSGVVLSNGSTQWPQFRQEFSLNFLCRVYNSHTVKAEVRIVRDGRQVLSFPTAATANSEGNLTVQGAIPLASFAPGRYALQVVASGETAADIAASQWADFEIVP